MRTLKPHFLHWPYSTSAGLTLKIMVLPHFGHLCGSSLGNTITPLQKKLRWRFLLLCRLQPCSRALSINDIEKLQRVVSPPFFFFHSLLPFYFFPIRHSCHPIRAEKREKGYGFCCSWQESKNSGNMATYSSYFLSNISNLNIAL